MRIKSQLELQRVLQDPLHIRLGRPNCKLSEMDLLEKLVNEQFSHCFNSYAQSYNKSYKRMGSLFKESFQRKIITSDDYLRDLICYIHNNPVHHGLVSVPGQWKHSSYNDLFSGVPTIINRQEIIKIFDTIENLELVHKLNLRNQDGVLERWRF